LAELIAGASIGLLVGLLVGLSASPVVGSVLSGLLSLLGAILGLAPLEGLHPRLRRQSTTRIAAFGIAAAGSVLLGVFIRANDVLSIDPSPADVAAKIAAYEKAGLSAADARAIVLVKSFGLTPRSAGDEASVGLQPVRQSVLFGTETVERCARIERISESNLPERLAVMQSFGDDWARLAARIGAQPEALRADALRSALALLCDGTS
jgi:hypothetical protein